MSKMNRFFAKVGNGFKKFGEKVGDTCDNAADSVRAKGLEIRIDEQYENLGRLTYRAQHTGEDLEQEVMEVIAKIDALFDEMESIKAAKEAGKRGMVVVVSEGVFHYDENGNKTPYGEYFTKKCEKELGIETRFARLAHLVRGGNPTLRDRLTASRMGVKAVELLIEGKSNLVVIEEDGKYVPMDIVFALTTDRMYKNKLKPGDLDKYSEEEIAAMKAICSKRLAEVVELYKIANEIAF